MRLQQTPLSSFRPKLTLASVAGLLFISALSLAGKPADNGVIEKDLANAVQDTVKNAFSKDGELYRSPNVVHFQYKYNDSLKQPVLASKRIIVVNGKQVPWASYGGIDNADYLILLNPAEAMKKYGEAGKFGALEATGKKLIVLPIPKAPLMDYQDPTLG